MPEIPVPDLDVKPAATPSPAAVVETPAPQPPVADVPSGSSSETDVQSAPSAAPDVPPASSAETSEPKSELLKVVTKAIQPKDTPKAEDKDAETQAQEGSDPNAEPDLPEEPTPDEMKGYSKPAQHRIRKLISERNAAYERVSEIEPFREYMTDNELSGEDLAFSLHALATLRKGDYDGFLEQIQPFVQMALEYTGRALPPDLQEGVKKGIIAPEVAVQVSRQRYDLGDAQQRLQRQQEEAEARQEEDFRSSNRAAVSAWEQGVRQTDPDYARKLEVAKAFVASIRAERGEPDSPQAAVSIAREAYDRASQALRVNRPARMPTPMSPSSSGNAPHPGAVAAPTTLMEAAMQGLHRAKRAS